MFYYNVVVFKFYFSKRSNQNQIRVYPMIGSHWHCVRSAELGYRQLRTILVLLYVSDAYIYWLKAGTSIVVHCCGWWLSVFLLDSLFHIYYLGSLCEAVLTLSCRLDCFWKLCPIINSFHFAFTHFLPGFTLQLKHPLGRLYFICMRHYICLGTFYYHQKKHEPVGR